MIDNLQVILLIIAGLIGTAIAIVLGWTESTEPVDNKKLVSSFIRGSGGIIIYIIGTYALASVVGIFDYFTVALFAAGFDAIVKRAQAVVALPKAPAVAPVVSAEQIQAQKDLDAATNRAKEAAADLAKATEAAKAVA